MENKAHTTHEQAIKELGLGKIATDFDKNDFLIGWKDIPGAYRYCHSFTESEIDHLTESVAAQAIVCDRFTSDGRSGNLNTYLILRTT